MRQRPPLRARVALVGALTGGIAGGLLVAGPTAEARTVTGPVATVVGHDLVISGTDGADSVVLGLSPGDDDRLAVDLSGDGNTDREFGRDQIERISVLLLGRNDTAVIDESNGVFTDTIQTTVEGGDGADTIEGGSGAERLVGGAGRDIVDSGRGADTVVLANGHDRFRWAPGDGNDTVDGGAGHDRLRVDASDQNDTFVIAADDLGGATLTNEARESVSLDRAEQVDVAAGGGGDRITVEDLQGTGISAISLDPGSGDTQSDRVTVIGSTGSDQLSITGSGSSAEIAGLPAAVNLASVEPVDVLVVNTLDGDDTIDATAMATRIGFIADGGSGNDTIIDGPAAATLFGRDGDDIILGGAGDDILDGGPGSDVLDGGAGDNVVLQ